MALDSRAALLETVQRKQDFLAGLARALDADHLGLAVAELTARETVSTSAIEGVRLDPDEVRSSIMRRLGLGDRAKDADRLAPSARGMIDALADSTQNLRTLSLERLFGWHGALFPSGRSGLSLILVGMLRGEDPMQVLSGPIDRERIHHEAPPRSGLEGEMRRFLHWFNGPRDSSAAVRASMAHLWFETLHPFEDGNGRLGRAVFDLALAQGAAFHSHRTSRLWAVSPVLMRRRREYYAHFEDAQKGSLDITDWLEWSTSCVVQAYEEARTCMERVVQVAHFWARHRDTPLTSRQRRSLEMALAPDDPDEGWLTARRAVRQTNVERVTASRDLASLERLGVIERDPTAGGRSTRYRIRLGKEQPVLLVRDIDWS